MERGWAGSETERGYRMLWSSETTCVAVASTRNDFVLIT